MTAGAVVRECRRINSSFFGSNAVFTVNDALDIILNADYLPPLLVGASATVAPAVYVAPIVPVVMISAMHEEPMSPVTEIASESCVRTAEVSV